MAIVWGVPNFRIFTVINFPFRTNWKFINLGVPILKHFTVYKKQSLAFTVTFGRTLGTPYRGYGYVPLRFGGGGGGGGGGERR